MKRLVLSLLFSLLGAVLFIGLRDNSCKASAYGSQPNILYAETSVLTESEIVANGYRSVNGLSSLQAGNIKVTIKIQNNTGYALSGIAYAMSNSYYELYLISTYEVACIQGPASSGLDVVVHFNPSQNIVAVASQGLSNCSNDGAIVSFFIKKKQNAPSSAAVPSFSISTINTFQDYNGQNLTYTEVYHTGQTPHTLVTYIIGDIDGDGEVTAYDSSVLMTVVNSTNVTLTAANAEAYFDYCAQTYGTDLDGMYPQNVFVFDAADVNQDGIIDSDDSDLIMSYFSFIVAGLDPALNPAIAHLGTTGYYVA